MRGEVRLLNDADLVRIVSQGVPGTSCRHLPDWEQKACMRLCIVSDKYKELAWR